MGSITLRKKSLAETLVVKMSKIGDVGTFGLHQTKNNKIYGGAALAIICRCVIWLTTGHSSIFFVEKNVPYLSDLIDTPPNRFSLFFSL